MPIVDLLNAGYNPYTRNIKMCSYQQPLHRINSLKKMRLNGLFNNLFSARNKVYHVDLEQDIDI